MGVMIPSMVPNMLPSPRFTSMRKNITDQKGEAGKCVIASVKAINAKPVPWTACETHTIATLTQSNRKGQRSTPVTKGRETLTPELLELGVLMDMLSPKKLCLEQNSRWWCCLMKTGDRPNLKKKKKFEGNLVIQLFLREFKIFISMKPSSVISCTWFFMFSLKYSELS